MANCPSCGCKTADAARFCPMCGVTINHAAADARKDTDNGAPRRSEVPQPNERLLECYATPNSCGIGVAKAMRVILALAAILLGAGSIAGGVVTIINGEIGTGVLVAVLGIAAALLVWFVALIGIVIFENISSAARSAETQNRISVAQLELISNIVRAQDENLRLSRQTVELLKLIDGDRFDAAKQAEQQSELLDKLVEQQRQQSVLLSEIRNSSDALAQVMRPVEQNVSSWKEESHRFIHGVALAISQLPDRLRDALAGSDAQSEEPLEDSDDAACAPEDDSVENQEPSAEKAGQSDDGQQQ